MKTNLWPVFLLLLVTAGFQTAKADYFTNTGSLNIARIWPTATLLPNGQVLVVGGLNGNSKLSSAELYIPVKGTWMMTNSMQVARVYHTATLLTNGQVLVTGGYNNDDGYLSSAELYNPASGTWTMANSLLTASEGHTATLLTNGRVLVAGGFYTNTPFGGDVAQSSAEIYDPLAGTWTATGSLNIARGAHTATLLLNGQVLVVGGLITSNYFTIPISSAELYDPANGTWMVITNLIDLARYNHTATLLPNGQVLVAGGSGSGEPMDSADLYNPSNMTWTAAGTMTTARQYHTATLLPNGKVLVAGGDNSTGVVSSAELFEPAIGTWTNASAMTTTRVYQTATLLTNGQVLVAGGMDDNGNRLSSAELYYSTNGTGLPFITSQPQPLTVTVGHAASFAVTATGLPSIAYQWFFGGANLLNSTNATLTLQNSFPNNAGTYTVVITNACGSVTSNPAILNVLPLDIAAPKILASRQFQFSFDTATGVDYAVQYSTNLTQWFPFVTLGGIGEPLTVIDPNTASSQQRFYRIVLLPQ